MAGLVLSVVALGGVLAAQALYSEIIDDVSESIDEAKSDLDKAFGEDTASVLAEDLDVVLGEFTVAEDEVGSAETVLVVTVTNKSAMPGVGGPHGGRRRR